MTNNIDPAAATAAETPSAANPPRAEQRVQADRRRRPTSPWGCLPPAGRRRECRRAAERARPHFVDRFSTAVLVFVLMLVTASLVDAVFTIQLIEAGGEEVNPVMGHLLKRGLLDFFLGKYLLTVVGLPLMVVFKSHYLFGTRLRVGHLIPALIALYAALICYQIVLMCQ
jgi:hypothetical protein